MQADRAPQLHQTPLPLAPVGAKAVALDCAGGRLASDAGLVLLNDRDAHLGCTRPRAAVLSDPRDPRRGKVPRQALLTQRVLPIAAG
jgi:Transposase DDE domain group 1